MTRHGAWTMQDIANEVGCTYAHVSEWARRGTLPIIVPTITDPNAPRLYIPAKHIEDVLDMARISIHGIPGWGPRKEVMERYGVSGPTVDRWVKRGRIVKLETYDHPLYNLDMDVEVARSAAARWEGFVKVHPRVRVDDPDRGRVRRRETFRPLSLSADAPRRDEHPTPAVMPEPEGGGRKECADATCTRPATDTIRNIGTFCTECADEKRKILGIRRSA